MARVEANETTRDRTLEDEQLVALWLAAGADTGPFGPYVQLLLLTVTRCTEASRIARVACQNLER
jgi:hypothetical protein